MPLSMLENEWFHAAPPAGGEPAAWVHEEDRER